MDSRKLVAETIKGNNTGRTPLYGWVRANLGDQITKEFGSVDNFEDHYEFDMAHIFGGPSSYGVNFSELAEQGQTITPEFALDTPLKSPDNTEDYQGVIKELDHFQKQRGRFCYIQTPGIFECINGVFGIENHLCNMALYPEQMKEIYKRQAEWNKKFANNMIDLGVDMVHVSDDWGAQRSMMFSYDMWKEMIYPNHKITCDAVKERDVFLSLHSDGNVIQALDGIVELGYDVFHPWQESAGMPYDVYLNGYTDKIAVLSGLCVQTMIGFGDLKELEKGIKRVFSLLKGKRWMFCTTHFIQDHCSMEELVFAFDLASKLARG